MVVLLSLLRVFIASSTSVLLPEFISDSSWLAKRLA